jgi:hypothetical protein
MSVHVLRECEGHMQESAPHFSASGLVRLGGCPAVRVEDYGKHSNVRLKIIFLYRHIYSYPQAYQTLAFWQMLISDAPCRNF